MRRIAATLLVLASGGLACAGREDREAPTPPPDWLEDWETLQGLSIATDTEGYELPTAIAFVPEPGSGPGDPLYFVAELRGRLKVVTNDRTVHVFADGFLERDVERDLPAPEGETGLGGLCLDAERGHVFATYASPDSTGVLRNGILRFESAPGTFSLRAAGSRELAPILGSEASAISHQIGGCRVESGLLYVGVGDGRQVARSRDPRSSLGKVLRMTVDGAPAPGNPFAQRTEGLTGEGAGASAAQDPAAYVWASGFRNPFGLTVVEGRVFVADNGSRVDRFVEVTPGEDYLWSGSDWSIGSRADAVIAPAVGPVNVDWLPPGTGAVSPALSGRFVVGLSDPASAGVLAVPYGLEEREMIAPPEIVLRHRGDGTQLVGGVARGPDGLYVVPILPDAAGRSRVLRIANDADRPHPYVIGATLEPTGLLRDRGCLGCHAVDGEGGTEGPALDRGSLAERLQKRLNTPEYERSVAELDRRGWGGAAYREARAAVRAAEGRRRVEVWTVQHILEPAFDNPRTQMPDLVESETEARVLAANLLRPAPGLVQRAGWWVAARLPWPFRPRHAAALLVAGFAAGALAVSLAIWLLRRLRPLR